MKALTVSFNDGIQPPARLGTLQLKLTGENKAAYGQNVDMSGDEYGDGAVVPGASLTTIDNNSELTGVPYLSSFATLSSSNVGWLWFSEGLLGSSATVRRVKDIEPSETPSIDTTGDFSLSHSTHETNVVTDMTLRIISDTYYIYLVGYDATDGWVGRFSAFTNPSDITDISALTGYSTTYFPHPKIITHSDGNLYIGHGSSIDKIDSANAYSADALTNGIPVELGVTELLEWQTNLLIAFNSDNNYTFAKRKAGGRSGIVVWDTYSPSFNKIVSCPSRYISAMAVAPGGQVVVFGGVDEGRTTIWEFNGYGFTPLCSYIGDMPRTRHSVDFDGQGRLMWQTADGQICRYDLFSKKFEHLGSLTTGSSAGGLFRRLVGGSGNEFLVASGSGSTYTMKRMVFGSYLGDNNGADGITTPRVVSGIQMTAADSTIQAITLNLAKPLESGERVELRVYPNGSTTYTTYLTMDYSEDGAISFKRISLTIPKINSFSLEAVWKMTDGATTAPPVLPAVVEIT